MQPVKSLMELEGDRKMIEGFIGHCDSVIDARDLRFIGAAASWKMYFEAQKKALDSKISRLKNKPAQKLAA